jgi:hypothetical protein
MTWAKHVHKVNPVTRERVYVLVGLECGKDKGKFSILLFLYENGNSLGQTQQ